MTGSPGEGPHRAGSTEETAEVDLGPLADWPTDVCRAAADDRVVVLVHEGEPIVLANRCPHRELPLDGGWVRGDALVCPAHFWRFRLSDGGRAGADQAGADSHEGVVRYPARVVEGRVLARVPPPAEPEPWSVVLRRHARSGSSARPGQARQPDGPNRRPGSE